MVFKSKFDKMTSFVVACIMLIGICFVYINNQIYVNAENTSYWYIKTIKSKDLLLHFFYKHGITISKLSDYTLVHVVCTQTSTMKTLWKNDFAGMNYSKAGYPNLFKATDTRLFGMDKDFGYFKAVDIVTGKEIWSVKPSSINDNSYHSIDVIQSKSNDIFYGRIDNDVFCFNAVNGKLIRKFKFNEEMVYCEIAPTVIVTNHANFYNTKSGKLMYSLSFSTSEVTSSSCNYDSFDSLYIDKNGFGYYRDTANKIVKFNLLTGKVMWKTTNALFTNITFEDRNKIYLDGVCTETNNPMTFSTIASIDKTTGKIEWQIHPMIAIYCPPVKDNTLKSIPFIPNICICPMPAQIHYSNNLAFMIQIDLSNQQKFYTVIRLSDGKQLLKKNAIYSYYDSISLGQKIFTGKTKDDSMYISDSYVLLDLNTGKELNTLPKIGYSGVLAENAEMIFIIGESKADNMKSKFCALRKKDLKIAWSNISKYEQVDNIEIIDNHFVLSRAFGNRNTIEIYNSSNGKLVKYLDFAK